MQQPVPQRLPMKAEQPPEKRDAPIQNAATTPPQSFSSSIWWKKRVIHLDETPDTRYNNFCFRPTVAGVAQLVEQLIRNQQVVGSSPILSFLEYL